MNNGNGRPSTPPRDPNALRNLQGGLSPKFSPPEEPGQSRLIAPNAPRRNRNRNAHRQVSGGRRLENEF